MNEELKISYYIFVDKNRKVHEYELAELYINRDLKNVINSDASHSIELDGAISVMFGNRELLGPNYWRELNYCPAVNLPPKITDVILDIYFNAGSDRLIVQLLETQVQFKLAKVNQQIFTQTLPSEIFIRQWYLMQARFIRLLAELGDNFAIEWVKNWENKISLPSHWVEVIGRKYIAYTFEADFAKVFSYPIP